MATVQESAGEKGKPTPSADEARVVFLVDASSGTERRMLEAWIERNHPASAKSVESVPIPPSRGRRRAIDPRLDACVASTDDPLLAPIRIAWLPEERDGQRTARFWDVVTLGDPRDPDRLRQWWLAARRPDRWSVVVGEPATASALREKWKAGNETSGLGSYVARQAHLALDRADRALRGARYKVPRFVHEEITSRPLFRSGVARLAQEMKLPERTVAKRAGHYLREIAATHSPFVIDLVHRAIRLAYTQGYSENVRYSKESLAKVYSLAQRHPLVFLPTHKSNLDHAVMQYLLHENGHPPNHTAGGINMNFFPVGPLFRRSGVFFIRRTFKDNEIYKFVLKQYVDWLVEKRFPMEWYIEGGRSRSGKLLPPRMGLLAYVADAWKRGKSEDVYLVPVSIAYDQISDVGDYVREQRGGKKEKESIGWFVRMLRGLRRHYGDIHIRFGEPVSLAEKLGAAGTSTSEDEKNVPLQKLSFEVCVRINRATPITPTSLVSLALLGTGDRALTLAETVAALTNLLEYVKRRNLPTTVELDLDKPEGVKRVLDALAENGVVSVFAEGPEAVYGIAPEHHIAAGYYRNTVIHFFVTGSIAELALLEAAEKADCQAGFWREAMKLRDLLKFEFFFPEKEEFRREISAEIALHDPEWESALAKGHEAIIATLRRFRPFSAHRTLRPFLEAYQVVGDALERQAGAFDENAFLASCLALGRQHLLQRRIKSAESISKVLFQNALKLAANRNLLQPAPDLADRRRAFAEEIRDAVRRVEAIDALAASRRAGLIA